MRPLQSLFALIAWSLLLSPLLAQAPAEAPPAEDPFGAAAEEMPADAPAEAMPGDEAPADDPFPADEADPDAKPKPKPKPKADEEPAPEDAGEPLPEADSPLDNPAIQAVLESNPKTPYELLRAIRILADLGQAELAAPYVDQLNGQQLDLDAKAALVGRLGSAQLIGLAGDPELGAKLGPYIDDLFRSAEAFRREPGRLAQWAGQLGDPSEAVRARAIQALLYAREASVAPLVAILADPARAPEHAAAKRMLVRLDTVGVPPLLGVLESPDQALKTHVIEVLGAIPARDAVAELLAPLVSPASTPPLRAAAARALQQTSGRVPDGAEAVRLLRYAAARALEHSRDQTGDGPPFTTVWHWDAQQKQSVPVTYDRTGASLAEAVRLAYQLATLPGAGADDRRLYLTALLQYAKLGVGLDEPLPTGPGTAFAIAAEQGPGAIESVLAHAMSEGYIPAATAAAQVLGDIGTPDLLARGGAEASALARAANNADRRLRFAATEAIVKLKPTAPFAGSSHVTEGLGFFAGSYGTPRILIAHPLSAEGGKLAGLAAAMGYEADVVTNGREAFERAVASPDYELVFIHSAMDRPAPDELLAQLRRDRRTASLPVGFIAPLNNLPRIQDFARRSGRAEGFLQPQNEEEMRILMRDVLAHAGRSYVSAGERNAQALAALDWLAALAKSRNRVFDVASLEGGILPLVYVPALAPKALELLGDIGTDKGQRALVELADSAGSLATRKAAVAVLGRSVRDHGILLTSDEIRRQYEFYNTNAGRNPETHEVLGALLDTLEHKGAPPQE